MLAARSVVLNALFLDPGVSGGPETYLRGLVPALLRVRPGAQLTVATTRRGGASLRDDGWPDGGIAVREFRCDEGQRIRRQTAEQITLPVVCRRRRPDMLHSLSSIAPIRVPGTAHVITLHDVNFIHHATFNPITTWGLRQVIPRAARRADGLIADTVVSRDDVCATLGLPPDRFTVIPLGGGDFKPSPAPPAAAVRARFELDDRRVVLCVGAKRPHKNQAVLVRAMSYLPPDVQLVLAGHAEPYEQSLRALTAELGLADRIRFAERVSDEELEGLWSVASVGAVPTLAEGFGLPVLEAMARGVPVAASDLPVLHEVADGCPRYFDPHDPADAARAILALLDAPPDPTLGRRRAQSFTWSAAAEATWEVYDRAFSLRRPGRAP